MRIISGTQTTAAALTQLTANRTLVLRIYFRADKDNTVDLTLGDANVAADQGGYELSAGDALTVDFDPAGQGAEGDLSTFYIHTATATQRLNWVAVTR